MSDGTAYTNAIAEAYQDWCGSRGTSDPYRDPKHADYSDHNYYTVFNYYTKEVVRHVYASANDIARYCRTQWDGENYLDYTPIVDFYCDVFGAEES